MAKIIEVVLTGAIYCVLRKFVNGMEFYALDSYKPQGTGPLLASQIYLNTGEKSSPKGRPPAASQGRSLGGRKDKGKPPPAPVAAPANMTGEPIVAKLNQTIPVLSENTESSSKSPVAKEKPQAKQVSTSTGQASSQKAPTAGNPIPQLRLSNLGLPFIPQFGWPTYGNPAPPLQPFGFPYGLGSPFGYSGFSSYSPFAWNTFGFQYPTSSAFTSSFFNPRTHILVGDEGIPLDMLHPGVQIS